MFCSESVQTCSALDLEGLELDPELEVSDNEEDAAVAAQTFADMVARDDALESTPEEGPGPGRSAFAQQPTRRLAHSQSTPANMTYGPVQAFCLSCLESTAEERPSAGRSAFAQQLTRHLTLFQSKPTKMSCAPFTVKLGYQPGSNV